MAGEFQIPGLTTLSHPVQASQGQSQNQHETPNGTSAPTTTGKPSSVQGSNDTTMLATPSQNTEPSDQGEAEMKGNVDSMVVDQPQAATMENGDIAILDAPQSPPSLTSGLEALLGGLDPMPGQPGSAEVQQDGSGQPEPSHSQQEQNGEEEHPEWEVDSSPYESSSDSSSSDDSSDEDESEDDKSYKVLGPEETARILMEMEGGSDDEGDGKTKGGSGAQVRTKNELPEEVIPKPDVTLTAETAITELGEIEHIVENTVVIKANTTGEYQVLDSGSVVCLENRSVIAAIADLIGSVRQPRYTARFNSEEEIKELGLELGTKIFYPPSHATSVFTQALRGDKGTDASNWHDEEAGDDEVEFSDDEKEAEYKRQQKAKKKGGRGGRDGASGRGGRNEAVNSTPAGLKYDDDDDGPYRPLARPPGFGQGQPTSTSIEHANGYSGNGGRGDFRGRGNRGRGGRGNRGSRGGHSLPPRPPRGQDFQHQQPSPSQQYSFPPIPPPQSNPPAVPPQFNGHQQANSQYAFSWPQNAIPNLPNMPNFFPPPPPPPPQFAGQSGAGGAYYNPAFFASVQNQLQGQYGGQQNGQWPGPSGPG
ncbi:Gar1/Naf1 RNA binding region-domain-containing protein [Biscogniauxia mediterranea]|nr:Gar1/Naf1 RNA binding region-domain-containing protein [Biscogniauxia mediterranea]